MTDHQTTPQPQSPKAKSYKDGVDPAKAVADTHDLSIKGTPSEWLDAERESPQDAALAGKRNRSTATVSHIRRRSDSGTLFLSSFLAAVLTGAGWMATEILGLFGTPWLAVPAGIVIALIIRAGSGHDDPEGRSTAAAIAYLVTFLVVMALLTRNEVHQIYGESGSIDLLEQNLFRRRFSQLDQLAAYVLGWAASWYVSNWLRS